MVFAATPKITIALLALTGAIVTLTAACKRQIQTATLKARNESGANAPLGPLATTSPDNDGLSNTVDQIVSLNLFAFPLPGGETRSGWCQCRGVGTSPHIGLDLAGSSLSSMAVSDGFIESARNTGSCGWEVRLRDANGALWRYLHMKKPYVAAGDRVAKGRVLGDHSLPANDCITGPHLHLERLSASRAIPGDKPKGNSCQYGYTSCNYNPEIVFQMNRSSTAVALALTGSGDVAGGLGPLVDSQPTDPTLPAASPCFGSVAGRTASAELQETLSASSSDATAPLQLALDFATDAQGRATITNVATLWQTAPASGPTSSDSSLEALCGTRGSRSKCLSGYSLYVREKSGPWSLAAEATGLAAERIVLGKASDQCFAEAVSDVRLMVRTRSGKDVVLAP